MEFALRLSGPIDRSGDRDELCAVIDVASDNGHAATAFDFIFASQLGVDFTSFVLPFRITDPAPVEYRVYVPGTVALDVAERRIVRPLAAGRPLDIVPPAGTPPLLVSQRGDLKRLCDGSGSLVRIGDRLQARLDGICFAADVRDDVNFVDELFFKKAYNFCVARPSAVIDIGMNVALSALMFAAKPGVREVHAFEPFPETFARGCANIALNPALAPRIVAHDFGLADGDQATTFLVEDTGGDSGAQSVRNVAGGRPVTLTLSDAGRTLAPIVARARRRGLLTIVKIDCEGAEFDVFASIGRAGLWEQVDFVMVEWHRMFEGRSQQELLDPLRRAGLLTVDLSPPTGNGFFYAARLPERRSRWKAIRQALAR